MKNGHGSNSGIKGFRNRKDSIYFDLLILSFNPSMPKSLNLEPIDRDENGTLEPLNP
jgi:hypothetical protein